LIWVALFAATVEVCSAAVMSRSSSPR